MTMEWYTKALLAANRIDPAHTSPWKLASTYALLCIAESLGSGRPPNSAPSPSGELRCANEHARCTESRGRQSLMVTTTYSRWPRWRR